VVGAKKMNYAEIITIINGKTCIYWWNYFEFL